jgi:hypothetical protein
MITLSSKGSNDINHHLSHSIRRAIFTEIIYLIDKYVKKFISEKFPGPELAKYTTLMHKNSASLNPAAQQVTHPILISINDPANVLKARPLARIFL